MRPDVFRSAILMSAPFAGPPAFPFGTAAGPHEHERRGPGGAPDSSDAGIHRELAALDPPRKHYHRFYASPEANGDMWHCAHGVHDFLRAHFHVNSADWRDWRGGPGNARPGWRPGAPRSWRSCRATT